MSDKINQKVMQEVAHISASNESGSNNSKIDTQRECDKIGEYLSQSDSERGYALNNEEKNYLKDLLKKAQEFIKNKLDKNTDNQPIDDNYKPDKSGNDDKNTDNQKINDNYKPDKSGNDNKNTDNQQIDGNYKPVTPDSNKDKIKDDTDTDANKKEENNTTDTDFDQINPDTDKDKIKNDTDTDTNKKEENNTTDTDFDQINPDSNKDKIKDDTDKTKDKKFIGDDGKMYVKKPDGSVYDLQGRKIK